MLSLNQRVPSYLKAIAPYQPGKPIADIARAYGFQEGQVVKLASNENPLGMSPKGREAMLKAAGDLGRYPDGNGFGLKQALARRFGLSTQTITLGNGSNDILELVAHAFLAPGKESLMSDHSFAVYALASQAVGATLVSVPAQSHDLGHDLDGFAKRITDPIVTYSEERGAFTLLRPINGAAGTIWGLEFALTHRLRRYDLPFLHHAGLYANYTYSSAEMDYGTARADDGPLPGNARHTANL